ncbi:MFS transporter, DHA2 family, multidrug resistance protein [Rhodococcus triatomae]|uniref:MFS transporter, DHA2 family, multidrug resistance protein n=1 Tax=Rhodococcus triatomae TaxID=300028 RepID=A0A1G8LHK3_9NOCA|nr:MFS transporter [Rhodococcus triatomae]SDI55133.1 MFS transporter, DHA2 family, multidrug resistance protein [Rhodococcus triatomae]
MSTTPDNPAAPENPARTDTATTTPRRAWFALTALVLPVLLASMDLSVLYLAMPAIGLDLDPTAGQALWMIDIYGFLLAGLLVTMGNVGDRIGRRKLLMIGAVVFGIGSVAAAFAPTAEMLIAARALMGIGGATLMPSTLSLIRSMFADDRDRTRAIAIWTGAFAGGSALGPLIGGVLLEFFSWGSVFLINVPVLAVLLIAIPILVPEYRSPDPGRLDPVSVVLSLAAVLPLVWAIKQAAEHLAVDAGTVAAAAVGVVSAYVFVRRQRRIETPLVDITLFHNHHFSAAVVSGALSLFALTGVLLFMAQHLQLVAGHGPLVAALWNLPALVAVAIGSVTAPALAERFGRPAVFRAALSTAAVGLAVMAMTPSDGSLTVIVLGSAILGFGLSPVMALATDLVVGSAPRERAGAASAVSETGNELGAALGIAVMGSVGAAVYRATIDLPSPLPAPVEDAAGATLPGALAAADGLPAEVAGQIAEAARTAFVQGMSVAALSGAVVLAGLAVVVPRLLRRR